MKKIIVVFKTHLDLGFTGLAKEIEEKYLQEYIPAALSVGEELQRRNCKEGFVWTTGSWLIDRYLKKSAPAQQERMRRAIKNGIIRWHALPFTMHSELASPELYEAGLMISQNLDHEFGLHTVAAKNTDVPGHTIAIVPLLAKAGVKFLHIGVNPASAVPEVPDFFCWTAPEGESVIVMYDKGDYGGFTWIPGTETAVCFAHTGDNRGPQSAEEILSIYEKLHEQYPDVLICAGSLEDVAEAILPVSADFPVVTQEIGDTWIHGVGTDPAKVNQYRALLRLAKKMEPETASLLYEALLPIPEHTWGLDEKTFLHDHHHYARKSFESVRNEPNYQKMEQSWQEQRDYLTEAVSLLPSVWKEQAESCMNQWHREIPDFSGYQCLAAHADGCYYTSLGEWQIGIGRSGEVIKLQKGTLTLADENHPLALFRYEVFSEKDCLAYQDRYSRLKEEEWAVEDFGKIGLSEEMEQSQQFGVQCSQVLTNGKKICVLLDAPAEAFDHYGCPQKMMLTLQPNTTEITFDFSWYNKPANRIPECCELFFCPVQPLQSIEKMGLEVDPVEVVSNGNREMHATSGMIHFDGVSLYTWDSALVSISSPSIYAFYNQIPSREKGVCFPLFNNQWGTNFPMWYGDDARFRFTIAVNNL